MKFTLPATLAALFVAVSGSALPLNPRTGTHMTQAAAQSKLLAAGIHASSTGGCTTQSNPNCTSYSGLLTGTVNSIITLKNSCRCTVLITGATEAGHGTGGTSRFTHANGYKLDVHHNSALDNYIHTKFTKIANRGDGFPQWKSAAGNTYVDEGSHWDITYF